MTGERIVVYFYGAKFSGKLYLSMSIRLYEYNVVVVCVATLENFLPRY